MLAASNSAHSASIMTTAAHCHIACCVTGVVQALVDNGEDAKLRDLLGKRLEFGTRLIAG